MVISDTLEFVYYIVPKCASTTVRKRLAPFITRRVPNHYNAVLGRELMGQHITIDEAPFVGEVVGTERYFSFSFVRDPYQRVYSGFLQELYAADNFERWKFKKRVFDRVGNDFNRYILECLTEEDVQENWQYIAYRPMHRYTHRDGKMFVTFVGRCEEFERDFGVLCRRLGIKEPARENANVRAVRLGTSNLDKYTWPAIQKINALYAKDFEYFGYAPIVDAMQLKELLAARPG